MRVRVSARARRVQDFWSRTRARLVKICQTRTRLIKVFGPGPRSATS
jgi:hypothetical protein